VCLPLLNNFEGIGRFLANVLKRTVGPQDITVLYVCLLSFSVLVTSILLEVVIIIHKYGRKSARIVLL
jgi:hypothetical protein